jgi:hypothetical protein
VGIVVDVVKINMEKYVFIGTEKDLIDNGFTYRPHYDDYAKGLYDGDAETQQDFYVQINAKTKEVGIYIQFLSKHRNQTLIEDGMFFLIQENIFPLYFNVIKELNKKGIIKENK